MRKLILFLALAFSAIAPALSWGADTLNIVQVREMALRNSPLQQKKLLAESIAALQTRNLRSNSLPRISVGAQATWQSDVFGLPIDNPLFQIPVVPKDQYKLTVEASQRIWDGGSDGYQRRQRDLEAQLAAAQVDADAFQVREVVTDLFFKILLLQENENVLTASRADLENRLKQARAAIEGGIGLRTTADQLQIQVWKTEQQIESVQADRLTLLRVLAAWLGRPEADFALRMPPTARPTIPAPYDLDADRQARTRSRPEFALLANQKKAIGLQSDALALRMQPKVEAFVQGGLGRPNPFNFFETGFEPFALLGLRAVWTPVDWGNVGREKQVLSLQMQQLDVQVQALDQRFNAIFRRDQGDIAKADALLKQDDDIIRLQEDIVRRAEAQVQNGVMTATDYLAQLNLLTQARLTRATHAVQAVQAREMLESRTGQGTYSN